MPEGRLAEDNTTQNGLRVKRGVLGEQRKGVGFLWSRTGVTAQFAGKRKGALGAPA